jgi:hypothetical protein
MAFRAEETLKRAVAKAIADHRRAGEPIVVWRDGKVTKVPADRIKVRESEFEYGVSDDKGQTPKGRIGSR